MNEPSVVTAVVPAARELVAHFPLPGLILDRDARVIFENDRSRRRIPRDWLAGASAQLLLLGTGEQVRAMQLADAGGALRTTTAYATPLGGQTVVVFDDRAAAEPAVHVADLQKRISELEQLSATDRLTGLWNRRHFDEVVARELAFSERERSPVSLLLFDLDRFKSINDRYGHATGDAVLQATAARLRETARVTDQVFRWGGEEFAVLAPATSLAAATMLAERLRLGVGARPFAQVGSVTISAGVAEHLAAEPAAAWFARVDAALYRAKQEGRDRVVASPGGAALAWQGDQLASVLRLVWSDACVSGNALIDQEHRGLFDATNALFAALTDASMESQAILQRIDALAAAVAAHFVDEEKLLTQIAYPKLAEHRDAHARLLAGARELLDAVHAGRSSPGEVVEFLAYEVVNRHILKADRQFFPFLGREGQS